MTIACADMALASRLRDELSGPALRLYTNDDVVGVELGGALKNVIAIAAGIVDGLGLGHNSAAALITRGIAEITRLALVCGGRRETMAGLAGLGDLVLTCTGDLSRNRRVGIELGKGYRLSDILEGMGGKVAEGVLTTARRWGWPTLVASRCRSPRRWPPFRTAARVRGRPSRSLCAVQAATNCNLLRAVPYTLNQTDIS